MVREVVLTHTAEVHLELILDYLHNNWGPDVSARFLARFDEVCELLSIHADIYPLVHHKKKIQRCILTKQNTLFYRIKRHRIEIHAIFDMRQDPDKLRYTL